MTEKTKPKRQIIAIDFDGILCEDKFPEIGEPNQNLIDMLKIISDADVADLVLWTCRVEDRLQAAVDWCTERGLKFTAINDNVPSNIEQYGTNSRKVYADIYVDDKNFILGDFMKIVKRRMNKCQVKS